MLEKRRGRERNGRPIGRYLMCVQVRDNLTQVAVMEGRSHWGYSYRVKADGTVELKQQFYWAHVPDSADDSGAGSACFDRDGRLYVATRLADGDRIEIVQFVGGG